MFQIYAFQVYDEFRELLIKIDKTASTLLPTDKKSIIANRNTQQILTRLRNFFVSKPTIARQLINAINKTKLNNTKKTLLLALVKLYTGQNSQYLNYYGPARSLTTIPFSKIINLPEEVNTLNPELDFKGKAIFVGLSEPIQLERVDTFYTPFSLKNGVDISGIEIGATAFANLLEDKVIQPLGVNALIILLLTWGLLTALIGRLLPTTYSILGLIGISTGYYLGSFYLFDSSALWLPTIVPLFIQLPIVLFVLVVWKYTDTNKERKKIRQAFGYFLPDHIVDDIAAKRKDAVAFLSPLKASVVNNLGSEVASITTDRNNLPSSSYAVMDSGWKYLYDKYNDVYRWVPLNGDVAGLAARTASRAPAKSWRRFR